MLHPDWVREHADEVDVMHIHFGFDHLSPDDLGDLVDALRETHTPLVLTVHDLRNPHHVERELHDAQLGVLVPAADALVTLTPGAAREIRQRWGREAIVLPHPHVVDAVTLSAPRREHRGFVIGVHLKSLRASMDPMPVIREVVAALPSLDGASVRVDAHVDVMTEGYEHHSVDIADELTLLADSGAIDLRVHDYFTDSELWDYLGSLDVSVLPYRFGTHSGWLEACFDLGTVVAAPDCGYYAEQRPCITYATPGSTGESAQVPTLTAGLARVHRERPAWRADPAARRAERIALARAHEALYDRVLAGSSACTS
ncbi:glycosyltransferase family 1 protein [Oryzobacter telluris]|uniref:glycosyltransferase family 1 protein n=1 Tax=Oryzobacter telluris TaxID=3149179 RepID=UPI00370D2055